MPNNVAFTVKLNATAFNSSIAAMSRQINSLAATTRKINASNANFAAQNAATVKTKNEQIDASVFKFRDSVAKSFVVINNHIFRTFRRLARLRTGFFILVTFLGVRPIIRLFRAISDESEESRQAVLKLKDTFTALEKSIAKAIAPIFDGFRNIVIKAVTEVSDFIINNIDTITGVFGIFETIVSQFKRIGAAIREIFLMSISDNAIVKNIVIITKLIISSADIIIIALQSLVLTFNTIKGALLTAMTGLVRGLMQIYIEAKKFFKMDTTADELQAAFLDTQFDKEIAATAASIEQAFALIKRSSGEALENYEKLVDAFEDANTLSLDDFMAKYASLLNPGDGPDSSAAQIAGKFLLDLATGIKKRAANQFRITGEDLADEFNKGFESQNKTIIETFNELGQAIQQALRTSLSDSFLAIMEQKFNKFRDIVVGLLNSIKKALSDFAADQVLRGIITPAITGVVSGIGRLFPGAAAAPAGGGGGGGVPTAGLLRGTGGAGGGGGGGVVVNINALDSRSVATALAENRSTLKRIINEAASGEDIELMRTLGRR